MSTYNQTCSNYEWGNASTWNSGQSSMTIQGTPSGDLAFALFTDLEFILSGDAEIISATLNVSGFADPSGTSAPLHINGIKFESPELPGGWSGGNTGYQDYRTTAEPTQNVDGSTSWNADLMGILAECAPIVTNGKILLCFTQDPYYGASLSGVVCSLSITYTIGDVVVVEADQPKVTLELSVAECSAEVHVNATQPKAILELAAATQTAVTKVLASQPKAALELSAPDQTAITKVLANQPKAVLELLANECSADVSVIATQPKAVLELTPSEHNAVTVVFGTQPKARIELAAGAATAVTKVLANQPKAVIELAAGTHAAVVPPVATQPKAVLELDTGRHWTAAGWKLLTASKQTVTAAKGS